MTNLEMQIEWSNAAYRDWRTTDLGVRVDHLQKIAEILRHKVDHLAPLITREMGKPISESRAEIEKCAKVCDYYAEHGPTQLADQPIQTEASKSFITFQPIGLILAIMPWNFPFWQLFRCAAPTLMAGNGILLKHAENVPECAAAIENLFTEAGFPKALVQNLSIDHKEVEQIIAHRAVQGVTLTGSVNAGKAVAALAGKHIKKSVLELGGSDPYVILRDANIEQAAKLCVQSRMINGGQSCIAAKRFIVEAPIQEAFTDAVMAEMQHYPMGDPMHPDTRLGPLATTQHRDRLHQQVQESLAQGANRRLGGDIPAIEGAYYPPTLLTNIRPGMPAYDDELFGPVASIIHAEDEADAIRIANDSAFGLGGGIFTRDVKRGKELARTQLESGNVFINHFTQSDPRLPFGGIRESGYGRELSHFGIHEFVNIKTISIA